MAPNENEKAVDVTPLQHDLRLAAIAERFRRWSRDLPAEEAESRIVSELEALERAARRPR